MNSIAEAAAQAFALVLAADPNLVDIVVLSLQVCLASVTMACVLGLPLGAAVAVNEFPGKRLVVVVLNALMGLPPVVVGLFVYLMLSRAGPLGAFGILFTPTAMVIAQTILIAPLMAALSRQVVADAWIEYQEQLRSLGETRLGAAATLLWDLRFTLATLVMAGFGRAASEVGAVIIVGGNIDGVTRVMTTTIALETSKGDLPLALGLGFILLLIIFLLNAGAYVVKETAAAALRLRPEMKMHTLLSLLPLRLSNVVFTVGLRRIIDGISLQLDAGLRTVIIGPNGAGKSVLLRLCHGLLQPTSGSIDWNAPEIAGRPRRQAMVFQRPVLLRRSALDNVTYALKLANVPIAERDERAREALRKVGLEAYAGHSARVLSVGEQQRLALARVWALRPEVLFLDEPTASLDPGATHEIETVIEALHAAGTKIVLVTHNLGQAHRLGDEILFLHQGRLVERAPADRFLRQPASLEGAKFLEGELPW